MRSTSSPRAVSMMIGTCDSARTLRHRLRPSSPGSMTSRINRSTRWSAIARAISRPSVAAATLQPLPRRYFAISDRVSRSSSTTRMLGDAVAMRTFDCASRETGREFLFPNISELIRVTRRNTVVGGSEGLVKNINLTVSLPFKNLWSPHDLYFGTLGQQLAVAVEVAPDQTTSGSL